MYQQEAEFLYTALSWQAPCERQQAQVLQKQEGTSEKTAAGAFVQHFVAHLVDAVWNNLGEIPLTQLRELYRVLVLFSCVNIAMSHAQ